MCTRETNRITVIVPVYNVEVYIEECLDSLINQTIPFDEVIIVNDGSTDSSQEICEKYTELVNYFTLINQKNRGLSAARNAGLKRTTSEYVLFLDADDYLRNDTSYMLRTIINRRALDAIYFDAEIFGDCINRTNSYDRSKAQIDNIEFDGWKYLRLTLEQYYVVSACLALYRRSVIEDNSITFPEGLLFEDNYFTFVYLCCVRRACHISEKLYRRRYRSGSIMMSNDVEKKIIHRSKCISLIYNYVLSFNSVIFKEQQTVLLKYISFCFHTVKPDIAYVKKDASQCKKNTEKIVSRTIELYINLLKKLCFDYKKINFETMVTVERDISFIFSISEWNKDRTWLENLEREMRKILVEEYINILNELPLGNAEEKIGIYGTGKHTLGLMNSYEKLIGEIRCEIVFINTQATSCEYMGRKVTSSKDIDESYNGIIISSFIYREEMLKAINERNIDLIIYDLYSKIQKDIFSDCMSF